MPCYTHVSKGKRAGSFLGGGVCSRALTSPCSTENPSLSVTHLCTRSQRRKMAWKKQALKAKAQMLYVATPTRAPSESICIRDNHHHLKLTDFPERYVLMFGSSASLPPRSGVFIFSLWLWCVEDPKNVQGKDVCSQGWGLRGVVGAGSPGSPSGSQPIPAAAAAAVIVAGTAGSCSTTAAGSSCFQHQLICQGQTSLLAFLVVFHRVHGNRPLKIHVRTEVVNQGNKCTVLSIQELWNLIQMNKK
ncbi:hypothetical protein EK904_015217 [Melospiza melodia maxima]|nr:hypothetical protein EK904_015217 [Melospiza melodia maxima]